VWSAGYRIFYEAWKDIFLLIIPQISSPFYFAILLLISVVLFYTVLVSENAAVYPSSPPLSSQIRLLAGGLLLILASFAPYLLSPSHLVITQRTFLGTAVGSAFVLSFLYNAVRMVFGNRLGAAAVAALLSSLCLLSQIYQFDRYNRMYASVERPLILALATVASAYRPAEPVVLVSDYGYLSGIWDMGIEAREVLSYLYPDLSSLTICDSKTGRILPRLRASAPQSSCAVVGGQVIVTREDSSKAVFTRFGFIHANGTVTFHGDLREAAFRPAPLIASRLLGLGRWDASESMFNRTDRAVAYECQFEAMWGYALPCRGYGFHEAEAHRAGLETLTFAWVGEPRAGLIIQDLAAKNDYLLTIDLHTWLTPAIDQIQVQFNGTPIDVQGIGTKRLIGKIDKAMVKGDIDLLDITAPLDNRYNLSVAVSNVELRRQ
jgi:hypothetical protein